MWLLAKQSLDEAPYKLSRAVAKLASITFSRIVYSSPDRHTLVSRLRENLLLYSSKPSLGVFQLAGHLLHIFHTIITAPPTSFLAPLSGKKWKTSARGVFRTHILYFVLLFCFTLFLLALFYIKNTKKLVYFIVAFIYLLLVHYAVP
jgi:hypothetical protein